MKKPVYCAKCKELVDKKVYCSCCTHYLKFVHVNGGCCAHPENKKHEDTYLERLERSIWVPETKNKNNDCQLYEEKCSDIKYVVAPKEQKKKRWGIFSW